MKVVYWSDYSCPFCYIGEARLKKAAKEAGVNIVPEMKAFQLDPTAGVHAESDTVTRFAKKYGMSQECNAVPTAATFNRWRYDFDSTR